MSTQPTFNTADLRTLEREIATDHCRTVVEYYATHRPSSYKAPVYDTSEIDTQHTDEELLEANRVELDRAVRYLDARELLVRPVPECPQFVAFKEQTS